jgi:putative restriction endonuclease
MKKDDLPKYIKAFSSLRTDRTGRWVSLTNSQAPHKPFLLLSVLDLFAQGFIQSNLIELTPDLGDLFATYWSSIMSVERHGNIALPFFHLRSSGFWHLIPQPGQEGFLIGLKQVDTLSRLKKITIGAKLDDELYALLQMEDARDTLRTVLIETYFSTDAQNALIAQTSLNIQSFTYSQELIDKARRQIKETLVSIGEPQQLIRDQGFRKAIIHIYEHRCAFCGVRLLTVDGHSVVEAAHIVPWTISHNDDLHNGMALCRLCHWTFDEGLLSVSAKYLVVVSPELRIVSNIPAHLTTLESRPIIPPKEQELNPDLEALTWHRQNVFRKV